MHGKVILLVAAAALMELASNTAQAREYRWCAYYGLFGSEATNCGFDTLAQCRATISGIGGTCQPNPAYRGSSSKSRSRRSVQSDRY
jgi:hypothetical protein